ncbi:AraC family transcriptional regulator [Cognatiyoonia sp. IB215182]|uniref:AraC family transcriptional regulator n=1 Tax=Cognatiyoonia sp. IB215182 TaxID=3097353 RepID=UPI002A12AE2C|nr:AraC family transcriptional regulator [Cognatiyoonia sp. IB215182]MDX8355197.1 AraC family transcriptional regulator [Cognatiyoonia sp. IB215182]
MTLVINNARNALPDTRLPTMENVVDFGNIRLIHLPPGGVDLKQAMGAHTFDASLGGGPIDLAVNSDRMMQTTHPAQSISFQPVGTDLRIRATNALPDCLLEVDEGTFGDWLEAGEISYTNTLEALFWKRDVVAAELARATIQHLMRAARSSTPVEKLTVEALALGIAARGMAQLGALDGDTDAEMHRWLRHDHKSAIGRAIDLIEARLCDSELSIQELASTACLSSSHFSSVFKSVIGETPYAFILRRRGEYARDLIIGTREPLAQIAFDAGFSSQAHMTVVIRRVFGVTPAAMRN